MKKDYLTLVQIIIDLILLGYVSWIIFQLSQGHPLDAFEQVYFVAITTAFLLINLIHDALTLRTKK